MTFLPSLRPSALALLSCALLLGCGDDDSGGSDAGCRSNAECAAPTSICFTGACVQCGDDSHCGADQICVDTLCVPDETEVCRSDADCPVDRPTCMPLAGTGGVCVARCGSDDDCPDGACIEGACVSCTAEAGSRLPTEACACDADCAGPAAVCEEGVCAGDCEQTGCPEGRVCSGDPGACVICDPDTRADGAMCLCSEQCDTGLECIGGFCGEACDFDETCGARECGHEVVVPASCRDVDPACFGGGTGAMGDECTCNADCDFDAPFCTGFFAEGSRGFVCSQVCGVESPCPAGFECCGEAGELHCMTGALATATGSSCL